MVHVSLGTTLSFSLRFAFRNALKRAVPLINETMSSYKHLSFQQQLINFYMFADSNLYPQFPNNDEAYALGRTLKEMLDNGVVRSVGLDSRGALKVRMA